MRLMRTLMLLHSHLPAAVCLLSLLQVLLAAGAEPDALNSAGAAPLHLGAQKGQGEVVAALLAQGADPNVRNAKGWGPVLVSLCV